MSIRVRVDDALFLWEKGRKESAFLLALVAVAATAKKRFRNKSLSDRERFEKFLQSVRKGGLSVEYHGECHSIEHIFYKWFRCELVHEGGLPPDIEFMPDEGSDKFSFRAGGAPEYVLKLTPNWFHYLINAVVSAPENKE